jgi:uncharacterized protein
MTITDTAGQVGPVAAEERIETLDILRGFALFGILLVNMAFFNTAFFTLFTGTPWTSLPDRLASGFIRAFAEGKFYTIFSFLFGLGFALIMQRSAARDRPVVPLYVRRLLALLLIGIAHAVLLWYGDILVTYALLGFVLLLFRNCRPRTLLIWAAVLLLLPVLVGSAFIALFTALQNTPAFQEGMAGSDPTALYRELAATATAIYSEGSYGEIVQHRLGELLWVLPFGLFVQGWGVLAMFLLGLYAGKRELFRDVEAHRPLFRRLLIWGLVIGLPLNLLSAVLYNPQMQSFSAASLVGVVNTYIGAPALSFAYIAAVTLLVQRDVWRRRLAPIGSVGRMALTNYLLQSLICTTLFYGYGLGLFGQVGPAVGLVLSVVIYAIQVPWSVWWLQRFQYGPMEWLWRVLTYGRRQPIRRAPRTTAATT